MLGHTCSYGLTHTHTNTYIDPCILHTEDLCPLWTVLGHHLLSFCLRSKRARMGLAVWLRACSESLISPSAPRVLSSLGEKVSTIPHPEQALPTLNRSGILLASLRQFQGLPSEHCHPLSPPLFTSTGLSNDDYPMLPQRLSASVSLEYT